MAKYTVRAYLCTNFAGLMDSLETDSWSEVEDFIWGNCQRGHNCELTDNETGSMNWAYADDFDEETLDPEELIRETKKQNLFYADLLMEQQEQM